MNSHYLISTVGQVVGYALQIGLWKSDSRHFLYYTDKYAPPAFLLRPAPPPGSHFFCAPRPLRPRAPANPGKLYTDPQHFFLRSGENRDPYS